ncbi:MAG: hypothetical protein H7255_13150 [Ramlibacter sp.]|nr:hypothetical protein [Ramlibacter sp.]
MTTSSPASSNASRHDLWTIAAIAIVAYCSANLLHEGLGHGGACLLVGCKPEMLNAIFFDFDEKLVADMPLRFIEAGGTLVNLVAGCIGLAVLRSGWPRAATGSYFLWLLTALNLLTAFGYFMFSGIGGIGDWAMVLRGWEPAVAYRLFLAVFGAATYFVLAPRLLMPHFAKFLNKDRDLGKQARTLMLLPYLVGGITFVIAGLFNPYGLKLVLISAAAASFGGTSLLAWYPADKRCTPVGDADGTPFAIERSVPWLVAAALMLIFFIGILGPGIKL